MASPLVSVILPTLNGSLYIKRAIESVLSQTYKNMEIVVVNDGSNDDTLSIIAELAKVYDSIRIINNGHNIGFVKSLVKAAREVSGQYIARIDDDDVWIDKKKIAKQVNFLESQNDYVLVGGGVVIKKENGKEVVRYLFPKEDSQIRKSLLIYNLFLHSSVVFSKKAYDRVGGYNEKFGFFADADLWLKLGTVGRLYNFPEYFVVYLDKEDGTNKYDKRDTEIRRRLFLRIVMKWQYRKKYPGFLKALLFCIGSCIYSFLPFREKIKPFLFQASTKLFGTPYKYQNYN